MYYLHMRLNGDLCIIFQDIEYVLSKRRYSDIVAPYDQKFEEDHAAVQDSIGGHMSDLACAPSDPLFWFHHVFIDCVFEKFRRYSQYTWPEKDYPVGMYGELSDEHKAYSFMEPFRPIINIHGLSNHYTNYYYECSPRPIHCKKDVECNSPYLWCDDEAHRCRSKIKILGKCDKLPNKACEEDSRCYHGVCSKPFRHMDHSPYFPYMKPVSRHPKPESHKEIPEAEPEEHDFPDEPSEDYYKSLDDMKKKQISASAREIFHDTKLDNAKEELYKVGDEKQEEDVEDDMTQ